MVTERQLRQIIKSRRLDRSNVLTLRPEDLPACYSAIVIDGRDRVLDPVLRWWHPTPGARWELSPPAAAPECPETLIRRSQTQSDDTSRRP